MNKCKKCGETKELSEFPKHKAMTLGVLNICKKCKSEYDKKRYTPAEKKPIIIKWTPEYRKEWHKKYSEENRERLKEKSLVYYYANKEKYNERAKKWAKNNVEKRKRSQLKWQRANRDKMRYYSCKSNNGEEALKLKKNGVCEWCGIKEELCIHHIDNKGHAVKRGERNNNIDNLMVLCRSCHAKLHRANNKLRFKNN